MDNGFLQVDYTLKTKYNYDLTNKFTLTQGYSKSHHNIHKNIESYTAPVVILNINLINMNLDPNNGEVWAGNKQL